MTATDVRVIDDWPAVHILARRPIAPTVVPRRDERIGNPMNERKLFALLERIAGGDASWRRVRLPVVCQERTFVVDGCLMA
jgi:hypothetical protein